ncbi:hypothetical protein OJF2_46480 [Aquisphaera giovannonii]|uniref:Putative restriction endonuclease domain-containing protein n=1 Tax=Aquisphaera giovannonii TaxID=406548 RepID=A0A5B9W6C3_9BACT|nr:Uma2 family endonuclease [Aquisphaera giovannonii]QEH36088.1 hypothetical protein OJF2_46480 [Aquisphaera giovannonii]
MSTAFANQALYTPDDLLSMPDAKGFELVRGRLVEKAMGLESAWVSGKLLGRLDRYAETHGTGWFFPSEAGYQCFPHDPRMVRKPDVSFVRKERLPGGVLPTGWSAIPPDLAVEVVSPKDRASELEEKLADYRIAGIPLIWVVYPESRIVMVHRRDGSVARLLEADSLSGEDVLPDFVCPIREILPPAKSAEMAPPATSAPDGPR